MMYRNAYDVNAYEPRGQRPADPPRPDSRDDVASAISRFPLASYEWTLVGQRGYFDLDSSTVDKYHMLFRLASPDHEWLELDRHDFLARVGALEPVGEGQYALTAAGLLMFGRERDIVRVFPSYFLDCRFVDEKQSVDSVAPVRWKSRFTSQDGDWSGNLLDFYHRAFGSLVQDFPATVVDKKGPDRDDALRAARTAVKEALVNALVNADFAAVGSITITRTPDAIEISNPGRLGVDLDLALAGGITNPYNRVIARMFALAGLCDRAGYGIPCIFEGWRKIGMPAPTIGELARIDRVHVVLPTVREGGSDGKSDAYEEELDPVEAIEPLQDIDALIESTGVSPATRPTPVVPSIEELPIREASPYPTEEDVREQVEDEEKPVKRDKRAKRKEKAREKSEKKPLRRKKDGTKQEKRVKKDKPKKLRLKDLEKIKPRKKKNEKKRKKKDRPGPMPEDIVAEVRDRLREQMGEPTAYEQAGQPPAEQLSPESFPVEQPPVDESQAEQTSTGHGTFMYHGHQLTWGDSGDPMD